MARIRTVKPEFWKDQELAMLSRDARLFYIGLWNFADDDGRVIGDPAYLKGQIFPYDEDARVEVYIEELRSQNKIQLYVSDKGEHFIHVIKLNAHQKIDKRYPSVLPAPPAPTPRKAIPIEIRCQLAAKYGAAWKKKPVKVKCALCPTVGEVQFMTRRWPTFLWLEIDHIKPLFLGGETVIENLQLLCSPCNRKKSWKYTPSPADPPKTPPERSADAAERSEPYMEGERKGSGRGEEEEGRGRGGDIPPPGAAPGDDEQGGTTGETAAAQPPGTEAPPDSAGTEADSAVIVELAELAHKFDPTVPRGKAENHIAQALKRGVKPEDARASIFARCGKEKLWHILDGLGPKPNGKPKTPYRPPERDTKPPPLNEVQRKRDAARAAAEEKLAAMPAGEVAELRKQAEELFKGNPHAGEKAIQAEVLVRVAKLHGIEGL